MDTYSIKDLEKLSGIKAHTIRIWEKRYGIIHPKRTGTNIRYYSNDDLKLVLNISLLNKNGYKISRICEMTSSDMLKQISSITLVNNNEAFEENLLLSLIEMNELLFNRTFLSMLMHLSFEEAMIKVVFPFFKRIGIMWQAGSINPAQEHFFSNLIRNKLIIATDTLTNTPGKDAKTVLLFLPGDELHEIGLLFYNYAFRLRGYKTIYLGQSVPYDSLERVINICKPGYIVTGVTNPVSVKDFNTFSSKIIKAAPGVTVFFTGPVSNTGKSKSIKNPLLLKDLLSFLKIKQ